MLDSYYKEDYYDLQLNNKRQISIVKSYLSYIKICKSYEEKKQLFRQKHNHTSSIVV